MKGSNYSQHGIKYPRGTKCRTRTFCSVLGFFVLLLIFLTYQVIHKMEQNVHRGEQNIPWNKMSH